MVGRQTVFSALLAAAIVVVVLGGVVATVDRQAIQHDVAISRAFCYQAYGDPTMHPMGGHGGFHCEANAGQNGGHPHLHQIPREYLERAYAANQSGEQISFNPDEVAEPCSLWGLWCMNFPGLLIPAVVSFALAVGTGIVLHAREGFSGGDT